MTEIGVLLTLSSLLVVWAMSLARQDAKEGLADYIEWVLFIACIGLALGIVCAVVGWITE